MIGHFPSFEAEELFYSVLARWVARQRLRGQRPHMLGIFGRAGGVAVVDLPANLDAFCRALPAGQLLDAAEIIERHTLYPYYAAFLPLERARQVRADLHGEGGPRVHARIGLMAGRLQPPKVLRYCPGCDAQDRVQDKRLCWRRLHQLPGVEVCPIHELFLEDGTGTHRDHRSKHGFLDPTTARACAPVRHVDQSDSEHALLLRLARSTAYILARGTDPAPLDAEWLRAQYGGILCTRGLATCNGGLRIKEICRRFAAKYPAALLSRLQCGLASGWLERLLRKPRVVQAPLRHLLMWDFLDLEADSFLCADPSLFGAPPFPCLNPVCPRRGTTVIHSFKIEHHHDRRAPVAAMLCPVCNYDYRRVGPDPAGERRWQPPDWVADYGLLWREHLRKQWNESGISLREMARTLGVDAITVKRQADKLKLEFPRLSAWTVTKGQAIYQRKVGVSAAGAMRQERRRRWLALTYKHPHDGRKRLRARAPALWTALYRQDRDWLDANSPARKVPRPPALRVDWQDRDIRICERVGPALRRVLAMKEPPVRVTFARLARELGSLALLQKCPQHFPAAIRRIEASIENREQFALRRLHHATESFRSQGIKCSRWRLIKAAGLRLDLCALSSIKKAIDSSVRRLSELQPTMVDLAVA